MALSITPTRVSTLGRITVAMGFVDPDRQCWDMMDDRPDRMDIRMSPNIFKNNHDALLDILPTAKAGGFLGLMRGECWRSCGHPCIGPVGSGFAGDCFSKLKSDTASTGV